MALTALAGPVSNFLLALLTLLAARIFCDVAAYSETNQRILDFLLMMAVLSIGLGLFNLVPIPPLDGSKVLFAVLPDRAYDWLMRNERYGMLLLFALVFFDVGSNALSKTISGYLIYSAAWSAYKGDSILDNPILNWKRWCRPGRRSQWRISRGRWI